jgi:hypothetical protein
MQVGAVLADKEQSREEVRGSPSTSLTDIYLSNVTAEPIYGNIWGNATMANFAVDIDSDS